MASTEATQPEKAAAAPTAPAAPATEAALVSQLAGDLTKIVESTGHDEMWGVKLKNVDDVPTSIVLTKYLRANNGDVAEAKKQLVSALEWRKKMQPLLLVKETFDKAKFEDLGYVTTHKNAEGKETVISWNIYGAVKDNKKTFGDVDEFIKWRAALMEMSVEKLNLPAATVPIPEGGADPYQMLQVHDYLSVSFFRPDANVKKASQEAIRVFSLAYPELLAHKYFVNVPAIMGWMYGLMKLFVAPATLKKFHPMSSGLTLASEVPEIAESLPKEYGGKGSSVKEGEKVALAEGASPKVGGVTEEKKEEVKEETVADKVEDAAAPVTHAVPSAEPANTSPEPAAAVVKTDAPASDEPAKEVAAPVAVEAAPAPGVDATTETKAEETEKKETA